MDQDVDTIDGAVAPNVAIHILERHGKRIGGTLERAR